METEMHGAAFPQTIQATPAQGRKKQRKRKHKVLRSVIACLLFVFAACAAACAWLVPVLRVSSSSMYPSLEEGDIVLCAAHREIQRGDVIAFRHDSKILIKRVAACAEELVEMEQNGRILVNDEPFVVPGVDDAAGKHNIHFPIQVPASAFFVVGDHRADSIDSRCEEVGCVMKTQVIGSPIFRLWPIERMGFL